MRKSRGRKKILPWMKGQAGPRVPEVLQGSLTTQHWSASNRAPRTGWSSLHRPSGWEISYEDTLFFPSSVRPSFHFRTLAVMKSFAHRLGHAHWTYPKLLCTSMGHWTTPGNHLWPSHGEVLLLKNSEKSNLSTYVKSLKIFVCSDLGFLLLRTFPKEIIIVVAKCHMQRLSLKCHSQRK